MKDQLKTLTPKLRFPEFKNEPGWYTCALEHIAERITTRNADKAQSRVLTNSAERGVLDQRDYFEREIVSAESIDTYYVVERGDYVYNPRTSANAPVGPISRNNLGAGVMSPLYTVFRFMDDDTDFYEHYFKSIAWHSYLRSASSTGARHDRISIKNSAFMQMPVPTPCPTEQRKIVACLTSLDELIAAEGRKVEALRVYKMGLMQQLFPRKGETRPRLRFPEFRDAPEWVTVPLGKQFETMTGGTPDRTKREYWGGTIPWITTSLVDSNVIREAEEFITEAGLRHSSAKLFPKGTVLVALYGQGKTRGKVALLDIEAATNQACAAIMPANGFDPLFTFLSLSGRYEDMRSFSNSGGQENLSQALIRELPFYYPADPAEREKVAACLSSLDALIAAQSRKRDGLRTYKKGLMRQIFPSPGDV
jgi:type I restriction enzyme, S subunit